MDKPARPLLRLELLSPASSERILEDISAVQLQLLDGSWLGIHPGHAPLLAATCEGLLKYRQHGKELSLPIREGLLSVADNTVSILTTR